MTKSYIKLCLTFSLKFKRAPEETIDDFSSLTEMSTHLLRYVLE